MTISNPQPNLSSFLWSVADLLRGDYKQSEYGKVILPFTGDISALDAKRCPRGSQTKYAMPAGAWSSGTTR